MRNRAIALPYCASDRSSLKKPDLNRFRRGLVSLYESQNLNSPFANSSLALGLFEEAGIKETPPPPIARFFICAILGFELRGPYRYRI